MPGVGGINEKLVEVIARAIADAWHDPIARWNEAANLPEHRRPPWDSETHIWLPITRAALAAIKAEGYAVVPREPTEVMIEAGKKVAVSVLAQTIRPEQIRSLIYTGIQEWRAMVEAAEG